MDRVWSERTWAGAAREAHQRHPNKSVRHRGRECRPRPGAKPPSTDVSLSITCSAGPARAPGLPPDESRDRPGSARRPAVVPGRGALGFRSTRLRAEAGPEPEQRPRHAVRLIE